MAWHTGGLAMATLTAAQLLALHPFPAAWASARRIERLWVLELPMTPAALSPWIADTSRLNRALGTAEMQFFGNLHHESQPRAGALP
jgi:hypothetical protein